MAEDRKPDRARGRGKRVAFALCAFLLCVALAAVVAEAGLRLFLPQQEAMRFFASSARYGFELKKSFHQTYRYPGFDFVMEVRTNSLGLRDREYGVFELARGGGTRVLLLGDSFAFGQGVNMADHYGTRLEGILRGAGLDATVIKGGAPGWGTLQETLYAKDHFELFRPDIVVITFCGNDPGDDEAFLCKLTDSQKGVVRFPGKTFIRNHSHLYRFVFYRFKNILHGAMLRKKAARMGNTVAIEAQSAQIITDAEWERSLEAIREFRDAFLSFNRRGIVLVQATAPWQEDIRARLAGLTNGRDLFFIDLFEAAASIPPKDRRLPYDGHWSPLMHSISARALGESILSEERLRP
ncbi:MAG: SGNH/GDSL hydrolase family protein [Candidatus Krumholzibacteria bacterium]|nr:SGNH/GDSL hydrolase family protein [Candidatus Krumholzibacteria bacterium]